MDAVVLWCVFYASTKRYFETSLLIPYQDLYYYCVKQHYPCNGKLSTDKHAVRADSPAGVGASGMDADTESFAAALEDLHRLSAEVLKQAEEDRRLFGM